MTEPAKSQADGLDKAKIKQYLVPAAGLAVVVILVGLVVYVSNADGPRMPFDGSNGGVDDPGLKEVAVGVKVRDVKVGAGEECATGSMVRMHYTGWREDGQVFDSSKNREPLTGTLKSGTGLILGWTEGIPGMKVGGIRKLVLAPMKAYGQKGKPPQIPGDSTLVFEVELVEVLSGAPKVGTQTRPRRTPAPADLTKLSDDSAPGADDPGLKPIGTSGLKYRDLKEGDGPVCPEGAHVSMDYTGWLTSGGNPFDSSWKPGRDPLDMSLGGLIKGWQQGVPGMKVGGIRKLVIPSDLGYGARGQGSDIPPNATLVFEIELLGFK